MSDATVTKALQSVLADFTAKFPNAPQIVSNDRAEIARHIATNATADEARPFIARLIEAGQPRSPGFGTIALALAGAIAAAVVIYGIFFQSAFLTSLANPNSARGVVTFLFSIATVAVVMITVIATFWLRAEEVEARAGVAKEVITIMIGIMGTILGFYFGSAQTPPPAPPITQAPPN